MRFCGTLFRIVPVVFLFFPPLVHAQDKLKLSGLAYLDYSYLLASPTAGEVGENGFGYRRLYLTTDYTLSPRLKGRVRLEANDATLNAQGRPTPFVKDLYLDWTWRTGHSLIAGVSPTPLFTVSERFFGYRSLEKTLLDRTRIVGSRDFGLAATGLLAPDDRVRYSVMFANNSGEGAERDRYKRLYGTLEANPHPSLSLTASADYAGYEDERDYAFTLAGFIGWRTESVRVGLEGFRQTIPAAPQEVTDHLSGLSLFGAAQVVPALEVVLRYDRFARDLEAGRSHEDFALLGLSWQAHRQVQVIPNLLYSREDDEDNPLVTGRLTLNVNF
jgi:hypothetical protein